MKRLLSLFFLGLNLLLLLVPGAALARRGDSVFGGSDGTEAALIGILYDLKQTQQGKPSGVTEDTYPNVLSEFINSEWDEGVLNKYFRVSRPVYATRIFIRTIPANQAPKAFGVSEVVDPRLWIVHYKGQVVAPVDGVYRLAGFADDFLSARVNGKTVLVSGRPDCIPADVSWTASEPDGLPIGNGAIRYGDWFSVKAGEVIDLDVLVGERPGGIFSAWLYIQRKGETYPQRDGFPVLPIFQLSEDKPPATDVPFAPPRESSIWKTLQ